MKRFRWLALVLIILLAAGAVAVTRLPELVRRVAVARLHAMTQRPVAIDRVELNLWTGRAAIQGFRLGERDGHTPFADVGRLDVRVRWLPLLVGHLHLAELAVSDSTVRVVRRPDGTFNVSDLVSREGGTSGPAPAITVDRFALTGGTVTLEDRGLPRPRTWKSERITISAQDLGTRGGRGRAWATSLTEGAPVAIELTDVRLHPIHLEARVTMERLDLTLARVYLPADTTVIPERGRVTTSMTAVLDARDGVRADLAARLEDVVLAPPDGGEPLALAPAITTRVSGFAFAEGGGLSVGQLALDGTVSVRDPLAKGARRFRPSTVRASVADLTWPATRPGRVDVAASVPGGGALAVTGTVQAPPAASDLRLRLSGVSLASWAQFLPIAARVTGVAEADLTMNEPLGAGIPSRVRGTIAVNRVGVADTSRDLLAARRIEASGIELRPAADAATPTRVAIARVLVDAPRGTLERDASGEFPIKAVLASPTVATPAASGRAGAGSAFDLRIGEVVVKGGAIAWRDRMVSPPANLEVSAIDARVTGAGWPLHGRAGIHASLRPPGGGQVQVRGRVGLDSPSADGRVIARDAELAPYRSYLPTTGRVGGRADLDVTLAVPSLSETRATARGQATLSHVDVRDGERTIARVERAAATGVDVDWPDRVTVERVALTQPWLLVERDDRGGLALRSLVRTAARSCGAEPCSPPAGSGSETAATAVSVGRFTVEGGGLRVVDQSVSPPFAVDLQSVSARVDGLSTGGARPARVELTGRVGSGAELALRGSVGPLGGPLRLDVNGALREFAVPRANPYLLRQVGWKSTDGRVTSTLQCKVDGDALSARTDIRLSQFHIVKAAAGDGAQARIGLPLGVLTSLMKNRRGDINVTLPIGGRLDDPRFDVSEAIWSAVRAVAINAITLPVSWIGRVRFSPDSRIERIDVDPVSFEPGTPVPTAEGRAQATRLAAFLHELPAVRLSLTPVVSPSDGEDLKPAEATKLGKGRLAAVREILEQAGVEGDRLIDKPATRREAGDGQVAADVLEPDTQRPSKVREVLQRLGVGSR